ncbi:putative protein phosphatase 2C 18 [Dendrobium catenatum]|uniref:protein-serine/threonine phosphatase n=1 Tax=Dendrobium catenatum TaxID=906689 RepID=A0A2I0VVP9_9ASPA|nr:putative protein phosphatase 2C 18 [Dendrobium catenatum]
MGSCLSSDGDGGRSSLGPSSLGTGSPSLGSRKGKRVGRRQSSSRHSLLESNRVDDQLHRIPGRMCLNGESNIASLFSQQGKKGINQDAMIVWEISYELVEVHLGLRDVGSMVEEAERIRRHRGRVFALKDEPEVARVWLPNYNSPGLAMARAFGDFCLKDFGLISVPEFSYRRVTEKDEFIVLATDGIWDVLSNNEVVDIVASTPARSSAARSLVNHAVRAWRFKYPTSKVDDCAVVCLFLNNDEPDIKEPSMESSDTNGDKLEPSTLNNCENVRTSVDENSSIRDDGSLSDSQLPSTTESEDWSALEGVTRANTMLTLPRRKEFNAADCSAPAKGNNHGRNPGCHEANPRMVQRVQNQIARPKLDQELTGEEAIQGKRITNSVHHCPEVIKKPAREHS